MGKQLFLEIVFCPTQHCLKEPLEGAGNHTLSSGMTTYLPTDGTKIFPVCRE